MKTCEKIYISGIKLPHGILFHLPNVATSLTVHSALYIYLNVFHVGFVCIDFYFEYQFSCLSCFSCLLNQVLNRFVL